MRFEAKPEGIKTIKTARSEEEINNAVALGFRPLIKEFVPNPQIERFNVILQHPDTRLCRIVHSADEVLQLQTKGYQCLFINSLYQYTFPPFAAYLIPDDLVIGERVWLEDLIEDLIGETRHQSTWRLDAAVAIWNGTDFEVQFTPVKDIERSIT